MVGESAAAAADGFVEGSAANRSATRATPLSEAECGARGDVCAWRADDGAGGGGCTATSLAMARFAFGAPAGGAAASAAADCVRARSAEVCAGTGLPVGVDAGVVDALASGTLPDDTVFITGTPDEEAPVGDAVLEEPAGAAAPEAPRGAAAPSPSARAAPITARAQGSGAGAARVAGGFAAAAAALAAAVLL